jgi:hypothetical protein
MSEELDEYELSSTNGELHVLFSSNRKWQKEDLNQIIGSLSRKIDLMGTTHSDISTLCQNVMRIERCRSFCTTFGLSLNVKQNEQPQTCDRVANVSRNTQLLEHMQELIRMLNYFEQTYGFPTVSAKSESLKDYLDRFKHRCMIVRGELTQIVKKEEEFSMFEAIHHQKVKEFEKHEEALTDVISEIYHGIDMINIHDNAAIAIIERYIKYLDQIIHVLTIQYFFRDDTLTDLDKCVLTPGCKMFNISREMSPPPIEILRHLKMKAERLLLLQQNMVSNWEQQQKQARMNASMHKNQEMRNKARALLTDTSSITEKDRLKMLAHSGSMKLLLDRLVKPPQSHYVYPGDQAKLEEMISDRVASKRPRYSGGSRKTKRRHKRSRRKFHTIRN